MSNLGFSQTIAMNELVIALSHHTTILLFEFIIDSSLLIVSYDSMKIGFGRLASSMISDHFWQNFLKSF
jgi:hypothetical protein